MKKSLVFFAFLTALAMVGYWNTGCGGGDDDGGTTTTIVVTNEVAGEPVVVTNTVEVTPEPPQTLFDETFRVGHSETRDSDTVTAPDDGRIIATITWNEGGQVWAELHRGGDMAEDSIGESPIVLDAETDDDVQWHVHVDNGEAPLSDRNIHITIGYEPEE